MYQQACPKRLERQEVNMAAFEDPRELGFDTELVKTALMTREQFSSKPQNWFSVSTWESPASESALWTS